MCVRENTYMYERIHSYYRSYIYDREDTLILALVKVHIGTRGYIDR